MHIYCVCTGITHTLVHVYTSWVGSSSNFRSNFLRGNNKKFNFKMEFFFIIFLMIRPLSNKYNSEREYRNYF